RVDQIKCMAREMTLIGFRLDPDRKEFCAEISAARLVEADVANVVRIGRANIEALVKEALRGVGVRVDDQSGVVNLARLWADHGFGRRRCPRCSLGTGYAGREE